nr:MAG TPA: hypothetical protein [Caudoviricetes sp.]
MPVPQKRDQHRLVPVQEEKRCCGWHVRKRRGLITFLSMWTYSRIPKYES